MGVYRSACDVNKILLGETKSSVVLADSCCTSYAPCAANHLCSMARYSYDYRRPSASSIWASGCCPHVRLFQAHRECDGESLIELDMCTTPLGVCAFGLAPSKPPTSQQPKTSICTPVFCPANEPIPPPHKITPCEATAGAGMFAGILSLPFMGLPAGVGAGLSWLGAALGIGGMACL